MRSFAELTGKPAGLVSGSSQIVLNDADKTGFDTADVAEGTNLYYTDTRVKTKLDAEGVISGSAQVTITESQISDLQSYLTSIPNNVMSSSAQVVGTLAGQNISVGELTATKVVSNVISQSISFASGSTIFGDELTDIHQITGSLSLTGSFSFTEIDGGNF